MPFNSSGVFSRLHSWLTDRDNGIKIRADRMDAEFNNFRDGLNALAAGTVTLTGSIKAPSGSATEPSHTFGVDTDTGFYRIGPNELGISTEGLERLRVRNTGAKVTGVLETTGDIVPGAKVRAPLGTAAAPSYVFEGDLNTGLYRPAANELAISTDGSERLKVTNTGTTINGAVGSTGNASFGGTLAVTGASTLTGSLTVNNISTFNNLLYTKRNSNEQIRLGSGVDVEPYISFYNNTTRAAHIKGDADRLRLVVDHATENDKTLDLIEDGDIRWMGGKVWHAGNDGSGSLLDADKLDGQEGSYYRNASNLNAGTVPAARLPDLGKVRKIHVLQSGTGYSRTSQTEGSMSDALLFYPVATNTRFMILAKARVMVHTTAGGNDARADLRLSYYHTADGAYKSLDTGMLGSANTQPVGTTALYSYGSIPFIHDASQGIKVYGSNADRVYLRLRGEAGYANNEVFMYDWEVIVWEYEA